MNLLFVHETEYIDKFIFEYQVIPELLASWGHKVFVVDYPTHWSKKHDPENKPFRSQYIHDVRRANKSKGVTLIRPGIVRIPVLSRIFAFVSYFFLINSVIKKFQIERIVLYSAPTNGIQTLLLARKYKIPVYFRLLDVLHQLVPSKILSVPTYFFEKTIYRRVDRISAITPRLRDYAVSLGADHQKSCYLPSGSDSDLFYYQPKDADLLNKYGLSEDDLVLLFAGTLYNFSGLDKIISVLPKFLQEMPNLKLLVVGSGEQQDRLISQIRELNLEKKVMLTGFINYGELPMFINLADICINPFEINKITNIIFPGKIYQYLACEKPVIATKLQGMLDIFPSNDTSSNIYYFDTIEEFYHLVKQIDRVRVIDKNPSLQEIAAQIEKELEQGVKIK